MAQIKLPTPPTVADQSLQDWIDGIHKAVSNLTQASVAPSTPTGLAITPIAGGNVIQFTRSNAVRTTLYMSNLPDRASAAQVDLGPSNTYTDNVGVGGQVRYYWVQGVSTAGIPSPVSGVRSGTTLALTAPNPVVPIAVQSFARVFDVTLDRTRPVISATDTTVAGQPTPAE